jgi:hypothetical protein
MFLERIREENNEVLSLNVLGIMSRNYRFSVSVNSNGYCFSEKSRCKDGSTRSSYGNLMSTKLDVINHINYSLIDRDYKLKSQREYDFFMGNTAIVPQEGEYHRVFFYAQAKRMVWNEINDRFRDGELDGFLVDNFIQDVGMMEISVVSKTVTLYDVTYKIRGIFPDSVTVDFETANQYLDIDRLVRLIESGTDSKKLVNIQMFLSSKAENESCFIFDLPIFLGCFFIPFEEGLNETDEWITVYTMFDNSMWDGNFMNFIK